MVIRYLENEHGAMRDPDKPFLLFWAPNPPHMPFDQVPEEYQTPYEGKEAEDLLTNPNAQAECTPPPAYDFAGKDYRHSIRRPETVSNTISPVSPASTINLDVF